MKIKTYYRSAIILATLTFSVWLVMANTLTYEQADCIYRPVNKYIWIKMSNGVQEKGVRFASDGVIFDSSIVGETYARNYPTILKIGYKKSGDNRGVFWMEFVEGNQEIGIIKDKCWAELKELVSSNPISKHIVIDEENSERTH